MKLLFWVLVLAVFFFLLGFKRARPKRPPAPQAPAPTPAPALPEDMVSCAECGMHLPASEALPGRGGQFCSAAHRTSHEARLSQTPDRTGGRN
ncbi:PP0621 family protein [Roseateles amylovorans]|uniref:PP0621 family protein n=1 Tax=Roseateles amylovorans TaxID=2978473 RepID=A0ABY6AZM0_9BURK|nr:PP0621 family protein [Roseateles amylovorans]UXH77743.1 PP0621 family protein [Roseateles amylovorans]